MSARVPEDVTISSSESFEPQAAVLLNHSSLVSPASLLREATIAGAVETTPDKFKRAVPTSRNRKLIVDETNDTLAREDRADHFGISGCVDASQSSVVLNGDHSFAASL